MTRTLLILLVCAQAASSLAAPAAAAVPAGNLVADPGAEQGGAATDAADVVAPPAPWVPEGPFTQVAYGAPNFPSTAVADSIGGGTAFFAGGPDATTTSADQNLDVEAAAEEIDAGTVTATLSADLGGTGSQEDSATVDVRFLDLESGVLGRLVLDAVTATDRGGQTILLPRSADGAVPVHTRRILVRVTALRDEGTYNDGYADNVSLTLHGPGPEPTPAPTPARTPTPAVVPPAAPLPVAPGPQPIAARFDAPARANAWQRVTLDASASTGAERYAWDLNGDGRTDVDCGAQPRVTVRFAPLGHAQSVNLAVTGGGASAHADQLVQITGPGLPPAAQRFGSTAFCDGLDPAHGVEDVTAHGGPRAGCGFAVHVGLVEGIGCLFRVNTRVKVDEPVLKAIALLYAQDPEYRAYVNAASTAAGLSRPDGDGLLGRKEFETALDVSDFYVSTGAVRVNGLDFYPRPGTDIVLAPALQRVIAENAIVKLGDAVVRQGPLVLDVSVKHGRVDVGDVNLTGRLPAIGSFPLTKQAHVTFTRPGVSRVDVHIRPPSWTSLLAGDGAAPTFDGTVTVTNAGGFDVAQIDAHLGVLSFGPWRLGDVNVGYRRFDDSGALVDRWQITGALTLGALADDGLLLTPPPRNGIIFEHGRFKSAGAQVVFDTLPPPQIFPGVALQQIGAHLELDPAAFLGSARLRVLGVADVDGKLVAAVPSADAPYKLGPLFRGMPTSLAEHPFNAPVFALGGTTKIRNFELGDGYFVYGYPGMVAFGGGIDRNFFDIVMLRGRIDGALNVANQRFNLVGQVKGCLIVRDFCGGATAVISSQGAGGCVEVGPVSAGGGVQWPHKVFPWPLDGCKWSRFTEDHVFESRAHASQAATRPYTVHIRAGDPSRAIRIDGTGGAPAVKVSGPDGETLESPAASGVKFGRHLRILRSAEHAITVIGLQDPPPGDYTIERLAGSAAWARTSAADDPPDARITARTTGTGARRTLHYAVRRRPDQRVTFAARGLEGEQVIGTIAGGGRGTLRFTPTPGRGKRTIVAHIELAGLPAEQPTVAHFRPPALPRRAGRPRRLRITRRARTLRLRWHRVPRAARYSIVVRERGGAIRQALTRRPRATIRRVPPSRAGTIAIRALDAVGASGPPRRNTFSARQSPRTAFAPYAQLGRRRSPERRGSTPRPPKACPTTHRALLLTHRAWGPHRSAVHQVQPQRLARPGFRCRSEHVRRARASGQHGAGPAA